MPTSIGTRNTSMSATSCDQHAKENRERAEGCDYFLLLMKHLCKATNLRYSGSEDDTRMASFVRITVLMWADLLAGYAMWVMITYLTNVWKLSFTHAAGIVNIWGGIAMILPISFAFLVDSAMGNYLMLLLSSISYTIGLGFLAMSTPPVLYKSTDTCTEYKPECIGHTQKVLFYTALPLIALGISGHVVALESFYEQNKSNTQNEKESKILWQVLGLVCVFLVTVIGGIALPYIRPWAMRFGIPAICTLVATLLFLSGSCEYRHVSTKGSPLTTMFRVAVATASKICQRVPDDAKLLYNKDDADPNSVPHLRGLRCLYKAAIILPIKSEQDQEKNRWTLCSVREVQETKSVIRMIPMWITFIICGVVLSIGNTYFLEQGNHMNRKASPSMKKYLLYFTNGVLGLGTMGSVLSVYIVGKVSEKGGRTNWFRYTLNESRLDRVSQVEGDTAGAENSESNPPFEDNVQCCCCCG
ncbi:hypothetical protein LguiA_029143 [Lonicera macranthoides]